MKKEPTITIKITDAIAFEKLMIEARDSHHLQQLIEFGRDDCVSMINELRKKLGR